MQPRTAHRTPLRGLVRRLALAACGTGLAAGAACSSASDLSTSDVALVQLSESAVSVRVGGNAALVARATDAEGRDLVGKPVFWSSRDPRVATVADGVVTGAAPGTTEISASVEGRSAVAMVTVLARPIASIQLDPTAVQLVVGATRRVTARAVDDGGGTVAAVPQWTTSDARVATVALDGTIAAVAPGVATVTATLDARTATVGVVVSGVPVASVRVAPTSHAMRVGETVQLAATPLDAAGNAVAGRTVQWSTPDPTVVSVSATGQVIGLRDGTATVHATVDGVQQPVSITVSRRPVRSVNVTPASSDITVGNTLRIAATPTDEAGDALGDRPVSFSSDASNVASVSASGEVTGVAPGATTIRVTSEGVTATASVRVVAPPTPPPTNPPPTNPPPGTPPPTNPPPANPPTVASVAVQPGTATLPIGQSATLQATARASDGSVIAGRTVTWSSGDESRVRVTQAGVVTALKEGTVSVAARIDGITGTAVITVPAPPRPQVGRVDVSPTSSSINVDGTTQFSATVRSTDDATLTDRLVTWSSSDQAVATVDANGRVTGLRAGTATIAATSEGVVGTATVTVNAPAPPAQTVTLRIAPATLTTDVDDRPTLSLFVRLNGGAETQIPGNTEGVVWTTSNSQLATVNGNGRVMPKNRGDVIVTATYRGASATAAVKIVDD